MQVSFRAIYLHKRLHYREVGKSEQTLSNVEKGTGQAEIGWMEIMGYAER
jgi:hypothetical protein